MEQRLRLVVLFGGQSAEHDVSCVSARHVLAALDPARYDVAAIGIQRDGRWVVAEEALELLGGEHPAIEAVSATGQMVEPSAALTATVTDQDTVVLPILHGPMGEDGTIQGLLELADVAYVGTGVLGSSLCMDKVAAKDMAARYGIAQCLYQPVHASHINDQTTHALGERLGFPLFVKPANMGSSVGVSKANDRAELAEALAIAARYDEWVIVEEAVRGREIEVGVLGPNASLRASVPGEIVPGDDFYSYDDKYHDGVAQTLVPADLDEAETNEVQALAVAAAQALRVSGLARVDFFYEPDGRGFLLNEINTMPGFTPISMYPKLWAASGVEYPELIAELIDIARQRHSRRQAHRSTEH